MPSLTHSQAKAEEKCNSLLELGKGGGTKLGKKDGRNNVQNGLATMKTRQQWDAFLASVKAQWVNEAKKYFDEKYVWVGATSVPHTWPWFYRMMAKWMDGSVAYNLNMTSVQAITTIRGDKSRVR